MNSPVQLVNGNAGNNGVLLPSDKRQNVSNGPVKLSGISSKGGSSALRTRKLMVAQSKTPPTISTPI